MPEKKTLILVTGLPRSGSTWVSQAFAEATQTHLVHEPFNWLVHPERIAFHMKYIPAGRQDDALLAILRQRIRWASVETLRRYAKRPGKLLDQFGRQGVLIKDVHICLAVESIWETLHPQIVILLRHPCAMAQSWQRLGLKVRFRIENLLQQKSLMTNYLAPFEEYLNQQKDDFFYNFGVYWGASYYVMEQLSRQHKEWQWVTHEELCVDSVAHYAALVERLGIKISDRGSRALERFIATSNRQKTNAENDHSVARLSALEPDKWKTALTAGQIKSIYNGVEPFSIFDQYYSRSS